MKITVELDIPEAKTKQEAIDLAKAVIKAGNTYALVDCYMTLRKNI